MLWYHTGHYIQNGCGSMVQKAVYQCVCMPQNQSNSAAERLVTRNAPQNPIHPFPQFPQAWDTLGCDIFILIKMKYWKVQMLLSISWCSFMILQYRESCWAEYYVIILTCFYFHLLFWYLLGLFCMLLLSQWRSWNLIGAWRVHGIGTLFHLYTSVRSCKTSFMSKHLYYCWGLMYFNAKFS